MLGEVTARLAEIVCGVAASCEEFGGVSLEEGVASVHAAREILQGFATAGLSTTPEYWLFTIEGVVRVWSGAAGRTGVRVEVFR